MMSKITFCVLFCFISILNVGCWEVRILEDLPDLDSYGVEGPPVSEQYDLYGMFSKQSYEYDNDMRKFYRDGNKMLKINNKPESCRSTLSYSF